MYGFPAAAMAVPVAGIAARVSITPGCSFKVMFPLASLLQLTIRAATSRPHRNCCSVESEEYNRQA